MASKKKITFDDYYESLYSVRWPALKSALTEGSSGFSLSDGLLQPYFLDKASAAAAFALGIQEEDTVLDMCAAPGGKTLVIALALKGTGLLVSNDRSSDRRRRLKDVIEKHLPADWRSNINVTGHDSTKWGLFEQDVYDRILLDAPCSSEAHVLNSPAHLGKWTPNRSKQLAVQAHAMLASAVQALKPGGRLIYSTCALSPLENDGVIEKLLKKRSSIVEVVSADIPPELELDAETTEFGKHILPDRNSGFGPIFMAALVKKQDSTL